MTGTMHVLDHTGDTKVEWDSDKAAEVEAARATFDALKAMGYSAYKLGEDDARGEVLRKFDPAAERIIMAQPLRGGCA